MFCNNILKKSSDWLFYILSIISDYSVKSQQYFADVNKMQSYLIDSDIYSDKIKYIYFARNWPIFSFNYNYFDHCFIIIMFACIKNIFSVYKLLFSHFHLYYHICIYVFILCISLKYAVTTIYVRAAQVFLSI